MLLLPLVQTGVEGAREGLDMVRAHPPLHEALLVVMEMAWRAGVMASATPVAMIRLSQFGTEMPRVSAIRKPAFLGRRKNLA